MSSQMMIHRKNSLSAAPRRKDSVAANRVASGAARVNFVSVNAVARASTSSSLGRSISPRKIAAPIGSVAAASSASPSSSTQEAKVGLFVFRMRCRSNPLSCLVICRYSSSQQYYALVANAEFYFNDVQNESLAEQLRERVRFFKVCTGRVPIHWQIG